MGKSTINKPIEADANNTHLATISSSFSGSVSYLKIGRLVVLTGAISTASALSNGTVLATGLPISAASNVAFRIIDNNNATTAAEAYINNSDLRFRGSATAASRVWKICGAYIANE